MTSLRAFDLKNYILELFDCQSYMMSKKWDVYERWFCVHLRSMSRGMMFLRIFRV